MNFIAVLCSIAMMALCMGCWLWLEVGSNPLMELEQGTCKRRKLERKRIFSEVELTENTFILEAQREEIVRMGEKLSIVERLQKDEARRVSFALDDDNRPE